MSYLNHCLELLGFKDIEDVNAGSLKRAFKQKVLLAHPDKGGHQEDFDRLLSAYVFLINLEKRIYGGRNEIVTEITPEELKENRIDEIIDKIFEEFQLEEFNREFENTHQKTQPSGYKTWLQDTSQETNLIDGEFGDATQKAPDFDPKDFNAIFESRTKEGKPGPSAIILHPEAMALVSGTTIGTTIIERTSGPYTSELYEKPEYCDVYNAFNEENTITDKLTNFMEVTKSLDDLISERAADIKPFDDSEMSAIKEFEKIKLEENKNNLEHIKNFFEFKSQSNSNLISHSMMNWPPEKYTDKDYQGFRMDF